MTTIAMLGCKNSVCTFGLLAAAHERIDSRLISILFMIVAATQDDKKETSNGMTDRYDFIGRPFDRQAVDLKSQM